MIGQKLLKIKFENLFEEKKLQRSILLVGPVGSGRRTFAKWMSSKLNYTFAEVGSSVDDVRELITTSSKSFEPTLYVISDVDQLSSAAQNALLKVLEEPPMSAYYVLTTTQESLVLSTIRSRCASYYMDTYSYEDLMVYANTNYKSLLDSDIEEVIYNLCSCPGDIDLLLSQNVVDFMNYVNLVFNNIAKVSGANSFKISSKINLGNDNTKFDLVLFWRAFIYKCSVESDHIMDAKCCKYLKAISITTKYLQQLRIKGLNKQMAFDLWILDIRKAWMDAKD